jgi:hypothetical protein
MPRIAHHRRTLAELFALAGQIGEANVLLTDAELGAVLAGDDITAFAPGSVANLRYLGRLHSPVVRIGRTPKTRLADALREVQRMTRPSRAAKQGRPA